MKKSKKAKPAKRKQSHNAKPQTDEAPADASRREFLRKARNYAAGIAIAGSAGLFVTQYVRSAIHEHDLTRLNNGRPTVVQIHDPQCPICQALQREARKALKHIDDDRLDFLIANIRSAEGRAFANRYGVPHVTLLLFDAEGNLKSVLQGKREASELRTEFEILISG